MNSWRTWAALVAMTTWCPAAQTLESMYRTAGPAVHEAFEPVRHFLQTSSAVIRRGREEVIFGTVVSPDGYILTKASELGNPEELSVIVDRDTFKEPRVVAEDPAWDVALIKIDATNLVPVHWSTLDEVPQGTWVVANGATTRKIRRVQVGVVSANEREVFAKGGTVLGVELKSSPEELVVSEVTQGSGAEKGGLKAGDRILSIDGQGLDDREGLMEALKQRHVGDIAVVRVRRDGDELDLRVELSGRVDLFGEELSRNDAMSGEYSERRTGFPRVMQHDIIANRHFMGGPVINLEGDCVGMNIARFSRCETYAIPAIEAAALARHLMTLDQGQP